MQVSILVIMMPKILSSEENVLEFRPRKVKGATLFMPEVILEMMADHADTGYLDDKEVMGLMMGTVYRDDLGEYAVVADIITTILDSNEVGVRFNRDSFEGLFDGMDRSQGRMVVGWYHSHPGFGCYLSETDINTYMGVFGKDTGFAIVIDPSDGTIKAFICKDGQQNDAQMVLMESI